MSPLHALILGIVEGATEFLPVSSTGHLILASTLLGLEDSEFLKTFELAIQMGAIAAVLFAFPRKLLMDVAVMKRVAVAFVPTAVVGYVLYKAIKQYLLGNEAVVVWALAIGGIAIIAFERWHKPKPTDAATVGAMTYRQAAIVGLVQSLAAVPGVSRSAATILGGLALGVSRAAIVEFSFLLAVPTIFAAAAYDLLKSGASIPQGGGLALAIGAATAFAVALASIRFLTAFAARNSFTAFGVYRIIAACVIGFILFRPL